MKWGEARSLYVCLTGGYFLFCLFLIGLFENFSQFPNSNSYSKKCLITQKNKQTKTPIYFKLGVLKKIPCNFVFRAYLILVNYLLVDFLYSYKGGLRDQSFIGTNLPCPWPYCHLTYRDALIVSKNYIQDMKVQKICNETFI